MKRTGWIIILACAATSSQAQSSWEIGGDARMFSEGNNHFGIRLQRTDPHGRYGVTYFSLDNVGPDPIQGTDRKSVIRLFGVYGCGEAAPYESTYGTVRFALEGAVEFPGEFFSEDESSLVRASSSQGIPSIAIPVSIQKGASTLRIRPTVVVFAHRLDVSSGGTIKGYGTVVAVEATYSQAVSQEWTLSFTGLGLLQGNNSVNTDSGGPERKAGYEARLAYQKEGSRWGASVFVTNIAGPTGASRVLTGDDAAVGAAFHIRY